MKTRTLTQNSRLHALLNELGVDSETKREMVFNYTNGRTTSTKELTIDECNELINSLEKVLFKSQKQPPRERADAHQKARRKIFILMYDCGFIDSRMTTKQKIAIINRWIANKTKFGCEFNSLTLEELSKFATQLQAVKRNYNEN